MRKKINTIYCFISIIFILLFTVASIYHGYVLFNLLTAILIIAIRPVYYILRNRIDTIRNNIILLIGIILNLYGMFVLYRSISSGITLITHNISMMLLTVFSIMILFIINKIISKHDYEKKKSKINLNKIILIFLIILNIIYIFYSADYISIAISIAVTIFLLYILITYNNYDTDKKINILMFTILCSLISMNFISLILSFILLRNLEDERNKETIEIFNFINNKKDKIIIDQKEEA